jgi:hypothetical protein
MSLQIIYLCQLVDFLVDTKVNYLGVIGYFASTGKVAEMFGWKDKK